MRLPRKRTFEIKAKFWKRTTAFITDIIIMELTILNPFKKIFETMNLKEIMSQNQMPSNIITATITMGIIAMLYFSLTEYYLGATPGMQLLRIRIKNKKDTITKAMIRNIYTIPIFPITILWITEPIMIYFKNQRWLEKITGTETIEEITV